MINRDLRNRHALKIFKNLNNRIIAIWDTWCHRYYIVIIKNRSHRVRKIIHLIRLWSFFYPYLNDQRAYKRCNTDCKAFVTYALSGEVVITYALSGEVGIEILNHKRSDFCDFFKTLSHRFNLEIAIVSDRFLRKRSGNNTILALSYNLLKCFVPRMPISRFYTCPVLEMRY